MLRPRIRAAAVILLMAGILFGSAGRLNWWMAWVLLAAYAVLAAVAFLVVSPELIEERNRRHANVKPWDFSLAIGSFLLLVPATLLVAGLDAGRFGWSPALGAALRALALIVLLMGYAVSLWAMVSNQFFSAFVRIQADRGQYCVAHGPYAFVRHPSYAASSLASLAVPIALGSLWAAIPALLGVCVLILRTAWEDGTLRAELAGYEEYASRVRWRLLPGVW